MKSHLSHILPVWKACEILGQPVVYRIGSSFIRLKESQSATTSTTATTTSSSSINAPGGKPQTMVVSTTSPQKVGTRTSDEDIRILCDALCYQGETDIGDPTSFIGLPDSVSKAWNKWLTHPQLQIDHKSVLIHFLVPSVVQPHPGPTGHMGLFDCFIYTLQGHAAQNSNPANTISNNSYLSSTTAPPTIWIPDILIVLAVTQQYRDFRIRQRQKIQEWKQQTKIEKDDTDDNNNPLQLSQADRKIVWTMALLAYRMYDSYQKKGIVQRDTIHRFLTDVHGEDSYKKPKTKTLLDIIFYDANLKNREAANPLQSVVSEQQFCKRVLDTVRLDDTQTTHLLLDWIALLTCSMIPTDSVPETVTAYLETMSNHLHQQPVIQVYNLAETRLYEIKRRFHSMVAKSSHEQTIIQGHPMGTGQVATADVTANNNTNTNSLNNNNNNNNNNNDGSNNPTNTTQTASNTTITTSSTSSSAGGSSKMISSASFVQAVSSSNEELGTGGYLPPSLAKLVFRAGCISNGTSNNGGGSSSLGTGSSHHGITAKGLILTEGGAGITNNNVVSSSGWGLYNVLQFGCMAVRHDTSKPNADPDIPLLRFLFHMFHLTTNESTEKRVLTRTQVAHMLKLLADYAVFRRRADCPPIDLDDDELDEIQEESTTTSSNAANNNNNNDDDTDYEANTMVDYAACHLLGLLPPDYEPPKNNNNKKRPMVPLKDAVDYALKGNAAEENKMSFDEFCSWHRSKMTETGPRTRLGPLMTELRLVASVQFGIPPVLASMEVTLIAEIERRHKMRYPQTDVSRRGPRGTVWHIIDAVWFTTWANLVKKTANTPQDSQDGRGVNHSDRARGLNRIRNTGLLVDNGTLALRPDIRWKHDYEILPPLAWSALQAWYDGGPPIYRSVVKYVANSTTSPHSSKQSMRGMIPTENEIELYPLFVTVYLCDAASRGEARPFQQNFQLSRVSPILVMLVNLCKELDVDPDHARLWVIGGNKQDHTQESTSSLSSLTTSPSHDGGKDGAGSGSDDWILNGEQSVIEQLKRRGGPANKDAPIVLLLELKDKETGLWPRGADGKAWSFQDRKPTEPVMSDLGDGVVGLYNMGNTCYMNSPIQCLSHTPVFREYFTSKAYLHDINTTNPLGHEGRLAQTTAVLINSLWKRYNNQVNDPTHLHKRVTAPGSYALVTAPALTPKTFKDSLSKFNEHFSGNEQHDAQELLAFLLGGLSEDLNRIVDKPYIEAPDSDGRPDSELADIWWSNHLKREMSIIVALFTGQFKSLLTCRSCKYESARFEPFSFLQVPLPEDDNLSVTLILYPLKEGASAMKYCVRVRNDGKLRDVLIALAKVRHEDEMEETAKITDDGEIDTESEKQDESYFVKQAQNFAVVDMRDGYISKIAPNSWLLQDLQNKDTGELPLLHVFELDPVPEKIETDVITKAVEDVKIEDNEDVADKEIDTTKVERPKQSYVAIAQRRSEMSAPECLHPLVHRVFGTPLLLRVYELENCTGKDLYDLVAKRLKNVVPKSVHRFLTPQENVSPPVDKEAADESHAEDSESNKSHLEDESQDVCTSALRTTTDMEEVAAGPVPRYGFRLRITSRDGRRCLSCPWYECCIGCLVPDDDKPTVVMDGDSAVVDWHFAVDVATSGFGLRPTTPELGQNGVNRMKNNATVAVTNHRSCGMGSNIQSALQQPGAVTLEECLDAFAKEEKIPEAYCSKCKDFRVQTKRMSLWRLPPVMVIHLKRFQFTQQIRRKLRDLVVFPIEGLDLSRIMAPASNAATKKVEKTNGDVKEDGETVDTPAEESTSEFLDDGRSENLYDLYGVVHHQGALSGGHYVASIKSELDGQWRLYNDAQIYEIHARDVVDASAYILFYIRRDVAKAKLENFWNVREEGNGLSEEDMDQLLKGRSDRCVIS